MSERIQKILSQWGIASRRKAETMIKARRVKLNGRIVHLGDKADLNTDTIEVDGKKLTFDNRPQLIYLLLNKPAGVVSTCRDPQKRPTVLDLLPATLRKKQGIHPVGRLDIASTGALILTNDGDLTLSLTHPRYHLPKTYLVWVSDRPSPEALSVWRQGTMLDNKKTLPAKVEILQQKPQKTLLKIIITEGRNRQIRRLAEQLGLEVISLHRQAIGKICLQPPNLPLLPSGHYRFLNEAEVSFLKHKSNT